MSKYRIGKRLKLVLVENPAFVWKVGDTGTVYGHYMAHPDGSVHQLVVMMDARRNGANRLAYGVDDHFVPLGKPPLLERFKLLFRRPSTDTTPGSWEGTGFDPNKTKEKEHGTENA